MKPILVTGPTGAIGSALVERLAADHTLRLVARPDRDRSAAGRLVDLLEGPAAEAVASGRIEVVEGDLTDPALDPGDDLAAIVHVAARTDFLGADASDYRPVNVEAAVAVAGRAARLGVPLVHVSTAHVCGRHDGLFAEGDLDLGQAFHNAYEASKHEAEHAVRRVAAGAGIALVVARPSIVLPDAPRPGVATGPGPLVYLELLAGLEGRAGGRRRTIRYEGDPAGRLNLVPLPFVVDRLARIVERLDGRPAGATTYHLTAGRSFTQAEIEAITNARIDGFEAVVTRPGELTDPDRFERLLARRVQVYRPYLGLTVSFDRSGLEADLGGSDGADRVWLGRVVEAHLAAWRAARRPRPVGPADPEVTGYFGAFLADKTGRLLVPGLSRLTADFSVTVDGVGSHRLVIESGRLVSVGPADGPSGAFDYRIDRPAFLSVVEGRARPSGLFFEKRVHVSGDLFGALSTATALDEFFRRFPYRAATGASP